MATMKAEVEEKGTLYSVVVRHKPCGLAYRMVIMGNRNRNRTSIVLEALAMLNLLHYGSNTIILVLVLVD